MLCDRCHENEAVVSIVEITDGKEQTLNLCRECAAKSASKGITVMHLPGSSFLGDILAGMLGLDAAEEEKEPVDRGEDLKKNNIVSYQIRRSDGRTFTASASAASFTDTSVTTGRRYSYTIRALCGESIYSAYSASKAAKAVPAGPKIKTKAGRKKITISWKKVAGAKGYQVYRAVKKKGSYKKVKTTRARSWINKGCKRGKMYYYKVRAYTKVRGKTVYGDWSSVSGRKAR